MSKKTIVINNEFMGKGDDELGAKLIGSFLRKLWGSDKKPDTIILYNSAVKLITEDSSVLDAMDGLYSSGVDILACGTCISHYQLNNKVVVGRVSNMDEIVSTLLASENVVTI
jgi:selenium metabolism protein YedF